ncbi:MAG TPA: transposase [Gammaproteobacteria bacterium]
MQASWKRFEGNRRMPDYRRDYSGNCWFFTVVTAGRERLFTAPQARDALREALAHCRERYPFTVDAWVLLPDHLHAVWTLPQADRDYSRRWSLLKRRFTQGFRRAAGAATAATAAGYWQRRFWAHRIDDEADFRAHVDYVHFNPVRHGLAQRVCDWPWSTFHRYVRAGILPQGWGGGLALPGRVGNE